MIRVPHLFEPDLRLSIFDEFGVFTAGRPLFGFGTGWKRKCISGDGTTA